MFGAEERVTGPRLRGGAEVEWAEAIEKAAAGLKAAGEGSAAIVGDASNEEGYLVQRIVREALGSPHVDSRVARGPDRDQILRLADPAISARVRDIDEADAVLVVGTDPLHSSPILDLRIRKAIRRNGTRLAVATDRPTALDGGAEAVVRYSPFEAGEFLEGLVAALRDEAENDAAAIAEVLRGAESVVIVWGERIGREGGAAIRAARAVRPPWTSRDEGRVGAAGSAGADQCPRPAGGGVPARRGSRSRRTESCIPPPEGANAAFLGRDTEGIRDGLESGELQSLILFGVDPLRDFPDTEAWKRALAAADHLVVFSTFDNQTTAMADVVFPIETHAEKDGTVTHPDGRLQRVRPSAARPGRHPPELGRPRGALARARP